MSLIENSFGHPTDMPLTKQELELKVFNVFLAESPDFLRGALFCVVQPDDDPPDISCETSQGIRIGFELKAWLHEQQMAEGRRAENLEESILTAAGPLDPNPWANIAYLWLSPRMRVRNDDHAQFRTELFQLIREIDERWPHEQYWHSPQGCRHGNFANYPVLRKCLNQIQFYPHDFHPNWRHSTHWLRFPYIARHYNQQTLLDPLFETIEASVTRYRRGRPANLAEFNLLLHYSQAFAYNAPVETQHFSFEDAMDRARVFIGDDPGGFDHIFLVKTIEPYAAYRLY